MHYRQREAGRNRGIHRVATVSHDLGTDAGRLRMRAGHHDVARPNRLKTLRPKRQRGRQQAREGQNRDAAQIGEPQHLKLPTLTQVRELVNAGGAKCAVICADRHLGQNREEFRGIGSLFTVPIRGESAIQGADI